MRDVPDFALVVGNPARQIGWVDKAGMRLEFDKNGIAQDSYDKTQYKYKDSMLEVINEN